MLQSARPSGLGHENHISRWQNAITIARRHDIASSSTTVISMMSLSFPHDLKTSRLPNSECTFRIAAWTGAVNKVGGSGMLRCLHLDTTPSTQSVLPTLLSSILRVHRGRKAQQLYAERAQSPAHYLNRQRFSMVEQLK